LWGQLEELLRHVGRRPGVLYVTNAGVYEVLGRGISVGSRP
jgi:hypothetical protein